MAIITVAETPEFQRRARAIMSDEERMALIDFIARNPTAGVSVGGGVRKLRFARDGGGKSGGYRVIHFYCGEDDIPISLITPFAKNEKANLTKPEKETAKSLDQVLPDSYRSAR